MTRALYQRQRRLEHKLAGLCQDCSNKAEAGRSRCLNCLGKNSRAVAKYESNHKRAGLCVSCANPVASNITHCAVHHYAKLQFQRKWYSSNQEKGRQWSRERYKKYEMEGKCISCGKPLSEEENLRCVSCRIINNSRGIMKGVLRYETAD